jgi:hypothetical protein
VSMPLTHILYSIFNQAYRDMLQDIASARELVPAPYQRRNGSGEPRVPVDIDGSRPVIGTRRVMAASHEPKTSIDHSSYDPSRNHAFHDYCDGGIGKFVNSPASSSSGSPEDSLSSSSNSIGSFSIPAAAYNPSVNENYTFTSEPFVPDPMANDIAGLHNAASVMYGQTSDLPADQADLDAFLASLPIMDNASLSMWSTAPLNLE